MCAWLINTSVRVYMVIVNTSVRVCMVIVNTSLCVCMVIVNTSVLFMCAMLDNAARKLIEVDVTYFMSHRTKELRKKINNALFSSDGSLAYTCTLKKIRAYIKY